LRILLLRLREIGDVIFTTPAIRGLREHYPDAHLTYVVQRAAAPVVAGNPYLNDVIVAGNLRGFAGLGDDLALGARLRAARYDIAIDFHSGPRSSLLTWLSRAPVRVGYDVPGVVLSGDLPSVLRSIKSPVSHCNFLSKPVDTTALVDSIAQLSATARKSPG